LLTMERRLDAVTTADTAEAPHRYAQGQGRLLVAGVQAGGAFYLLAVYWTHSEALRWSLQDPRWARDRAQAAWSIWLT
jgi:hypothetical protein